MGAKMLKKTSALILMLMGLGTTFNPAFAQSDYFSSPTDGLFGENTLKRCKRIHFFYHGGKIKARCHKTGEIQDASRWNYGILSTGAEYLAKLNEYSELLSDYTDTTVDVDVVLVEEGSPILVKTGYVKSTRGSQKKAVYLNAGYIGEFSYQYDFVLAHELAHWALGHSTKGVSKDKELAADYWAGFILGLASDNLFMSHSIGRLAEIEPSKEYYSRTKRKTAARKGCERAMQLKNGGISSTCNY